MSKTNWMQNESGGYALGSLSNPNTRYKVIEMSPYERERRAIFEDFRSRIIDSAQLKEELASLKIKHCIYD